MQNLLFMSPKRTFEKPKIDLKYKWKFVLSSTKLQYNYQVRVAAPVVVIPMHLLS